MDWRTLVLAVTVVGALEACDMGTSAGAVDAVEEPIFEKSVVEDLCALLTPIDVAQAAGVPVEAIEQQSSVGCAYHWDVGESWEAGSVFVSMARAHGTLERARSFHGRTRKDPSAGGARALPDVGSEAAVLGTGSVVLRYGNVTARFSGELADENLERELAAELGRRLVDNLARK